jgi:hypothetical protein
MYGVSLFFFPVVFVTFIVRSSAQVEKDKELKQKAWVGFMLLDKNKLTTVLQKLN